MFIIFRIRLCLCFGCTWLPVRPPCDKQFETNSGCREMASSVGSFTKDWCTSASLPAPLRYCPNCEVWQHPNMPSCCSIRQRSAMTSWMAWGVVDPGWVHQRRHPIACQPQPAWKRQDGKVKEKKKLPTERSRRRHITSHILSVVSHLAGRSS